MAFPEPLGIHQRLPNDNLVRTLGPEVPQAAMFRYDRDGRDLHKLDLDSPVYLQLIEQRVRSRGSRIAVLEIKVSEPRLDGLGAYPAMFVGRMNFDFPPAIEYM